MPEDKSVEVNVTSPFSFNAPDGRTHFFRAGLNRVPAAVADDPFVQAHLIGKPKGRMPVVSGGDGLLIEADEAGQLVNANMTSTHPLSEPLRQEGDPSWHRGETVERRQQAETEAGAVLIQSGAPGVAERTAAVTTATGAPANPPPPSKK